jgi:hypothetical protein
MGFEDVGIVATVVAVAIGAVTVNSMGIRMYSCQPTEDLVASEMKQMCFALTANFLRD